MSFLLASALLRGGWLIEQGYAEQHLPLVIRMVNGEGISFGDDREENTEARVLAHAGAGVYGVGYYTDLSKLPDNSIAVLDIIGPVTKYGDMCSYGSAEHASTIGRLANAPNVSSIILNIDSPGGQVDGTTMLADAVKAASSKKPVVAMIDDGMAASAAMWIASAADEIYVTKKTDQVGSIGVYCTLADWVGYAEKQGLKVREIYAPQSTEKNGTYRQAIAGNEEPMKQDLAVIADEFISTIKKNRAGKLTSDKWNSGGMFYAKEAKQIGLIDGIKSFDQVIKRTNQLAQSKQQQSNSFNMAFENTLVAAAAESFDVVEGGFLLSEEQLSAIEASLVTASSAAADSRVAFDRMVVARDEQALAAQQATSELVTAQETIATQAARIQELEAGAAGKFTETAKEKDDVGGSDNGKINGFTRTSVDEEADRLREMKNKK
jgi:protease IV